MNNKYKIQAFTIGEMLVVLLVTSIVITLALLTLNIVQKQLINVQKVVERNNQIILLERILWQDFNGHTMTYETKTEELQGINASDTVIYKFKEDYVLRNKDTIKVAILKKNRYLDGNSTKEKDLDAIELIATEQFQSKEIFIFTKKDASYYLNK